MCRYKLSFYIFSVAVQATQEKNRMSSEMNEVRDHLDIKDRKISVLQRKVRRMQVANYFLYIYRESLTRISAGVEMINRFSFQGKVPSV
jgi:hypothetical protein